VLFHVLRRTGKGGMTDFMTWSGWPAKGHGLKPSPIPC
jgi:hypothetical protein